MGGSTAATVEHYIGLLRQLREWSPYLPEALSWWVVRSRGAPLSLAEVIQRLGCVPTSITQGEPRELTNLDNFSAEWDPESGVYIEARGSVAVLVEAPPGPKSVADRLHRLSEDATVHGVFWLVNNLARVYLAADGRIVTEVDPLRPDDTWGDDPRAIDGYLGPLRELHRRDERPSPDWETAMATVEAMTGVRLTADWFARPRTLGRFPR
jgi:hypothetical protein